MVRDLTLEMGTCHTYAIDPCDVHLLLAWLNAYIILALGFECEDETRCQTRAQV